MADDLDYLLNWQPGQPLEKPASSGPDLGGQYQNFTYKDRMKDTIYLADLREYFAERGITDKTDEELDQLLHDDSNYRDLNTLGSFFGARGSQSDLAKYSRSDEARMRASRLHLMMQEAPTIFSSEGRSVADAAGSIAGAIVTDPVNWALGAVEAVSGGTASPLVAGARAALSGAKGAAVAGAQRGLVQAGKFGAAEGAITGVIGDAGQQGIEQELGLSKDYSLARGLEAGVLSAGMSAGIGGVFGAVGGAFAGRRGGRVAEGLKAKGYSEDEISAVLADGERGLRRLQETEPDIYRQMMEDMKAETEAATGPAKDPATTANELEEQMRDVRISSHLGPLNEHLRELHERLAGLRADNVTSSDGVGLLDDQIGETLEQIANLEEARHFPASVSNREKIIAELLRDPDASKREKGRQMAVTLAEDRARFEAVMASNVPEDISSFISDRVSNRDALEAGRRFETEDEALDEAARKAAFRTRQKTMAQDASQMAQAESISAKESGELAARTDSATANQARLTEEQVSSADAAQIIQDDLEREAKQMAEREAAKAAEANPPAEPEAMSVTTPAPAPAPAPEAPAPQPAKVPVTQSTRTTKVNASNAARRKALSAGVDISEVTGTGKNGRVLEADIANHAKTAGPSESWLQSVALLADVAEVAEKSLAKLNVPSEQISTLLSDPEVFRTALINYNKEVLRNVYDDDAINSLVDIFKSNMDNGTGLSGKFDAPTFKSPEQQENYAISISNYVAKGVDEETAKKAAAIDIAYKPDNSKAAKSKRADAVPDVEVDRTKVDPRMVSASRPSSPLGRMDNAAPIPVDEKGNPLIRLQSILRTGRAFTDADGSEYSITSNVPQARTMDFDKAREIAARGYSRLEKIGQIELRLGRKLTEDELLAERSLSKREIDLVGPVWAEMRREAKGQGRAFNSSPVQPFLAKGGERVRDKKTKANRGDTLYISGRTGKAYADWREAYKDTGLPATGDQQPKELVAALSSLRAGVGRSTPSRSTAASRIAATDEAISLGTSVPKGAQEMSSNDFFQSLAEISGASPIEVSATAPIARPDLPPLEMNGKRAFFINKKTGAVRVPTDKQISAGHTAERVLGKSNPNDWTVEYHEKGYSKSKVGLDKARVDYQEAIESKAKSTVKPAKAEQVVKESFTSGLVPKLAVAREALNTAILDVSAIPGVDPAFGLLSLPETFTGRDLMAISDMANKLPLSGVNHRSLTLMKAIAEIETMVMPQGIRKAQPIREKAIAQARNIFGKLPDDILSPITDILTKLADGMAPEVAMSARVEDMSFNAQTGTIIVPEKITKTRAKTPVPQSFIFFHEIGHWAHLNLLSSQDRAEFWQWAIDNLPDESAVRKHLGMGDSSGANKELAAYLSSYYSTPAEFFAESFARWATGRIESASNPSMWKRFAKYVKGIFDNLISGKQTTDRDLERLFLKIMPDEQVDEVADNLDAIANGLQPVEEVVRISPLKAMSEATAPNSLIDGDVTSTATRPNYMALPLSELLEMGDETRTAFIQKLAQVHSTLREVQDAWELAQYSLDPETAFEAYRKTQSFLIGTCTSLEEKRKYLSSVARATNQPMQEVYSRSDEAFSPFRFNLNIVPRAKKLRRMLSLARTGKVQAMDENNLVDLGNMPETISEVEALEAGLNAGANQDEIVRALMGLLRGENGKEAASLDRLFADMHHALNTAYERTGLIPDTPLLTEDVAPRELLGYPVGKFHHVTAGDVMRKPGDKKRNWVVEDVNQNGVVRLRENNGDVLTVQGHEIDQFSRLRGGVTGTQVEAMRSDRLAKAKDLRQELARKRVDEARRIAYGKLEAIGELPDSPNAPSPKAVPTQTLERLITSNTELAGAAADELVSRDLTKPMVSSLAGKLVATPLDEAAAAINNMRTKLLDGDDTVDNDVAAFATTSPDRIHLSPRNKAVNLAIKQELEDARGSGAGLDTGIPYSAPPRLSALLTNVEHRNRRVKHTARTLLYRIVRVAHPNEMDAPNVEAFTPETEAWTALRGRIRSIAETIATEGEGDPSKLVDRLVSLVADTNPDIKRQLDDLSYSKGDASEILSGMLGHIDRPIENGERKLASDLFDTVGYMLNGLMGNEGVRNVLYRATYFNDLFSDRHSGTPHKSDIINMTISQAKRFSAGNISPAGLGIDAETLSRQGYNDLVLMRSDGQIVSSPYDGFDSFKELAQNSLRNRKAEADSEQSFHGDRINDSKTILGIAAKADALRAKLNTVDDPKQVERLTAIIDDHLAILEELGVPVPRFSVMAAKVRNPFDGSVILDSEKLIRGLRESVADAVDEGDIPADIASKIDLVLSKFKLGQSGDNLMRELNEVLTGDFTAEDFMQSMGYDGIKNKFGQLRRVFDKDRLAQAQDFMDPLFYAPRMDFDESLTSPLGETVNMAMMSPLQSVNTFSAPAAYRMASKTDDHGMKHWLLNFGRNRVPRKSDMLTPLRMKHKFLGSNSARMRSAGMVTLGDWFEDHFPWVQQEFSRRLIGTGSEPGPLKAIRTLSDVPSRAKRHLANSTGQTLSVPSHKRILNALWEPSNPRHEAKLSAEESKALKVIRDSMTKVWVDLKDAGVMMGSRGKEYFPQVWSQTAIRKDSAGAIAGFKKYFELEALRNGQAVNDEELTSKATSIVAQLAAVDDDSLWKPDVHSMVAGAADQIDYGRKIELDRYPEALPFLRDFLEQDLESYLVKYFDQATHRLSMARKFGHRNHAFGDYMTAVVDGRDGIAKLLSSRRTQEHSSYAMTPEDGLVDVSFSETYPMPFERDPSQAVAAADDVIDIHRKLGPEQARRHLMSLAVPDQARGGKPSVVYERRVSAIIDALRDFNGEPRNITSADARFLNNAMKVAARRPLIGDTTYMVKAAKNLRAFNSVTLLAYTTISSLGDAFLPVVRSGNMRDAMRAWGSYMNDPDYREAMRGVGAHIESLLHNRMTHMTGTPANRLTSAFFNAIGLTPWTDEARAISTAVGLEAFKTAQKKALRVYDPSRPIQNQGPVFRQNWRLLKRYGLEEFATKSVALDHADNLASDKVRVGLMKFVDDAVFSPNGDDIPIWAQTPWGAVLFQLKSFPMMMGRMAKEVLYDDLRLAINDRLGKPMDLNDVKGSGSIKRAAYMLTLMPLVGYGINTAHDIVRGRGGEEGGERKPASRTLSQYMRQLPSFDKDYQQQFGVLEHIVDRETLDAFAGQYLSGLTTAAGLGLVASMLTDAASQAENGAFGTERMMSTVFGPSMGTAITGWHMAQGVLDGNANSNYPERTAAREALRRVPILGGQNGVVNSIIENAMPAKHRSSKQKPKLFGD